MCCAVWLLFCKGRVYTKCREQEFVEYTKGGHRDDVHRSSDLALIAQTELYDPRAGRSLGCHTRGMSCAGDTWLETAQQSTRAQARVIIISRRTILVIPFMLAGHEGDCAHRLMTDAFLCHAIDRVWRLKRMSRLTGRDEAWLFWCVRGDQNIQLPPSKIGARMVCLLVSLSHIKCSIVSLGKTSLISHHLRAFPPFIQFSMRSVRACK